MSDKKREFTELEKDYISRAAPVILAGVMNGGRPAEGYAACALDHAESLVLEMRKRYG